MNPPLTGNPRRVPAAAGFAWLAQSLFLVRRQAGRLLLLALLMQLVLGLTQLPLVGLLIILSVPALNAGLLEAFHVTARDGRPELRLLFRPLASGVHVGRLFAMGALVFAVGVLSISVMLSGSEELLDPGATDLGAVRDGAQDLEPLELERDLTAGEGLDRRQPHLLLGIGERRGVPHRVTGVGSPTWTAARGFLAQGCVFVNDAVEAYRDGRPREARRLLLRGAVQNPTSLLTRSHMLYRLRQLLPDAVYKGLRSVSTRGNGAEKRAARGSG